MKKLLKICAAAMAACGMCLTASAEDGYIESEGDAFVSLGHCVGPNTKIEVDFQLTEVEFNTKPFGSWGDRSTIPMFSLYISHVGDNVPRFSWDSTDADGNRQALNCDVANLNRHVISFDVPTQTYSSTDLAGEEEPYTHTFPNPFPDHTSPYPLAVFGRGTDSPATQLSHFGGATKMKVYGVRIYESGALVKTYVPCLKGGVPGLKVTGPGVETFVVGLDPSKVKYGGDIMVEPGDPCISTEINDVYTGLAPGERIYLDTGYLFKTYSRVELDFAPLTPNTWTSSTPYNYAPEFMYARSYNPTYELEIVGRNSSGVIGVIIGKADPRNVLPLNVAYGIRRTISVDSNSVSMATAGYTNYASTITAAGFGILKDLETTLKLGSAHGSGNDFAPMKIYGLKIFESGELVKDFRPVVTNGVPGLVDVEHPADVRFASTCAGGIRTNLVFEAYGGFDCTDGSDEAYLDFPGTTEQRIDTGLVVTNDSCVEVDFALWNTGNLGGVQQVPLVQDASDGFLVYCYINSEQNFGCQYADYVSGIGFVNTHVRADNTRKQLKFDGPNRRLSIKRGEETLYDEPLAGEHSRSGGSGTLKFASSSARMRLYGFRVTTAGEVVRDYVPCMSEGQAGLYELCTKTFTPVEGAKVRGAKSRNAEGVPVAFQVPPKDAKVTKKENDVPTFTCVASGAQSYEWYADGALVEGETNDTLTVNWRKLKKPFTVEYSVVPVYTVFNETVKGAAATAVVTMPPKGTALFFK